MTNSYLDTSTLIYMYLMYLFVAATLYVYSYYFFKFNNKFLIQLLDKRGDGNISHYILDLLFFSSSWFVSVPILFIMYKTSQTEE